MNPIFTAIGNVLTTIVSPILDKTVRDPNSSVVKTKTKNGISISSKRILNLVGTGSIITVALGDMTVNGLSWESIALVGLGICYSMGMALISSREK